MSYLIGKYEKDIDTGFINLLIVNRQSLLLHQPWYTSTSR